MFKGESLTFTMIHVLWLSFTAVALLSGDTLIFEGKGTFEVPAPGNIFSSGCDTCVLNFILVNETCHSGAALSHSASKPLKYVNFTIND